MATKIITKNSSTASAVPLAADLVQGELAVNVTDKKLYTKNSSGTVVKVGDTPSIVDNGTTTAITIDSSNNVGIGVSPSAWGAGQRAIQVGNFTAAGGGNGFTSNGYYNAGWKYVASGYATNIYEQSGGINFDVAPSGTAGNAISFTRAMTLDSSGNLLVGTTSSPTNAIQTASSRGATVNRYEYGPSINGNGVFYVLGTSGGVYLTSTGTAWTSNSDQRLKTALTPFKNAVEKVCSLRAGTGRYLADDESISRSFLIAQDVQAVLPEAVFVQNDEMGTLGLAYTDLIPLLTAAIKELNAKVDAQAAEIAALKGQA